MRKGLVSLWVGLNEGSEDLGMLSEITQERVAAPTPHNFHRLNW